MCLVWYCLHWYQHSLKTCLDSEVKTVDWQWDMGWSHPFLISWLMFSLKELGWVIYKLNSLGVSMEVFGKRLALKRGDSVNELVRPKISVRMVQPIWGKHGTKGGGRRNSLPLPSLLLELGQHFLSSVLSYSWIMSFLGSQAFRFRDSTVTFCHRDITQRPRYLMEGRAYLRIETPKG